MLWQKKGRYRKVRLSKNFTLEELLTTSTLLANYPSEKNIEKLLYLANFILQPVRERFGKIKITSGYRSKQVNYAIGGSPVSQHLEGEAVDFIPLEAEIDMVFEWMKMRVSYGQLIKEEKNGKRWIHVSLPRMGGQNMQAMTFTNGEYKNA